MEWHGMAKGKAQKISKKKECTLIKDEYIFRFYLSQISLLNLTFLHHFFSFVSVFLHFFIFFSFRFPAMKIQESFPQDNKE